MYHLYKNVRSTDLLRIGWPMKQHLRSLEFPETLFWHGWKSKTNFLQRLGQTPSNTKKLRECKYEQVDKTIQKQPSRGVLRKKCSENMQQIYRRTPMAKCDFDKAAYWNLTSAWVFSCKFAAYFQNNLS